MIQPSGVVKTNYRTMLLAAPPSALHESVKPMVSAWGNPPTALQVLQVLDKCGGTALASGFTMRLLHLIYDQALEAEEVQHEDIVLLANWRVKKILSV